jgi:predicted ester cyclase
VFAEGSQVADRSTTSPVHQGGFLGLPASGQQVRDEGIVIFRFDAGRVAELWYQGNDLQIAAQPG